MDWYIVIKTIKGRRYRYRQKTWREGKHVRTRSEYIGPAEGWVSVPAVPEGATTLSIPFPTTAQALARDTAAAAFELVMSPEAEGAEWEHHWDANRRGPSRVQKAPEIEALLARLDVTWSHAKTGCYFSPREDRVNIPPASCFIDKHGQTATQAYYIVIFHELVHWSGVQRRLARGCYNDYPTEELVAELGAVMLMKHFGLEVGYVGRHAKYFQGWLSRVRNKIKAKTTAQHEAERAVQYLLNCGIIDK